MADIAAGRADVTVIGISQRGIVVTALTEAMAQMDWVNWRPKDQAWLEWRKLADTLARPGPGQEG